jgi:hypothetical protein
MYALWVAKTVRYTEVGSITSGRSLVTICRLCGLTLLGTAISRSAAATDQP